MRSYTNKDGELIVVSEDHLKASVRIKRELQMSSPSYRCNWNTHKKMMEQEGFSDSESSENYRCLIKNYQSAIGELPSVEKHADLISTSKLESIKEATGELYYTKREVQLESLKLGKLKREMTLFGVVAEGVYHALINELDTEIPKWSLQDRLPESENKMIVGISDIHTGTVVINVNGNYYNYSIAQLRLKKYVEEIFKIATVYNVTEIIVVALGDLTEHVSMRNINQAFETEFTSSVQITKAFELVRDFLVNLTQKFNVTYMGISGNHDRMNGNKNDNIDGDSTVFVINYMVKIFAENKLIPRLRYVESDNILYSAVVNVNGSNIKFVHGDNEKGSNILALHSKEDHIVYNAIVMGHLHHYHVQEVGANQYQAYFGSLMGRNNYSKKGKFSSDASQGIILVNEYGELDFRRVGLQYV